MKSEERKVKNEGRLRIRLRLRSGCGVAERI
jgi:hypothetical protein